METPIKMDDLGGKPTILGNPQIDFHVNVGSDMFCFFQVGTKRRIVF